MNSHYALPILNGMVGDRLAAARDPRAIQMSFRHDGRDAPLDDLGLDRRLRGPGRTLVVLVHGLMCDEVIFEDTRWQDIGPPRPGYGARLTADLGATVLSLRYNSGLHISQNGQELSALLESLVERHSQQIQQLVLIGHSMGALVVRSAGHHGAQLGRRWIDKLGTVVLVAIPSRGSYLEQVANLSSFVLNRVPTLTTGIMGQVIDLRSDGIKDLRFGLMVDEDWLDRPYDDRLFATRALVEPLPGVDYHVLLGILQDNEASPVAAHLGDGMVGRRSAMGLPLFGPADPLADRATFTTFPGTGHLSILTDPEVGRHVTEIVRRNTTGGP
jgi:pimeloyl-ACP methyl ester carboxylesterase